MAQRVRTAFGVALAVASIAAFAGCSDDDEKPTAPGVPTTSSFAGFMTDGTKSGKISMTVNTTTLAGRPRAYGSAGAVVTVTASVTFDGATFTATGTYNDVTDSLNMSGGGYSFTGEYEDSPELPSIVGEFSGPNAGLWAVATGGAAGVSYCGNWSSDIGSAMGTWNVVTIGDLLGGVAYGPGSEPFSFLGSLSGTGTSRTITGYEGDELTYEVNVDGTLDTTTGEMSGTWSYTAHDPAYGTSDNGSWSGVLCP